MTFNNYRPVALVPIMSKVLERVIFNQLMKYLTENELLNPNHHAYRANHSTATAMLQMYDEWVQAVDKGKLTGVCLLDMSAAFDVVDHSLLCDKLAFYGFQEDFLDWLRSYLGDRKQGVCINGTMSKLLPVLTGVPQGSILGPLLYTLFTNELPGVLYRETKNSASICCYADDTTITSISSNHSQLSNELSKNYDTISRFMINNRLKLNDDKSHLLVL